MANITSNRISQAISDAQKTTVIDSLKAVETELPWLIGLNVTERMTLPKISSANRDFVADAIDIILQNPDFFPAYFNTAELEKDFNLYNLLNEIIPVAERVVEKLSDTQMLAGSEAYVTALTAYRLLQSAAQDGIPGADALYDRLKSRFENQGGSGGSEETTNPTP